MTMYAGTPRRPAARASAAAWLPDEWVQTPRAASSSSREKTALVAPRALKAPTFCRFSHLKKRDAPAMASMEAQVATGVRWMIRARCARPRLGCRRGWDRRASRHRSRTRGKPASASVTVSDCPAPAPDERCIGGSGYTRRSVYLRGRPPACHRRGRSPSNQPTRDHADGATMGRPTPKASRRPRRPG